MFRWSAPPWGARRTPWPHSAKTTTVVRRSPCLSSNSNSNNINSSNSELVKRVLHLSDNLVCFSANALYLWQNYAVDFVVLFVIPWNIKEKTNIWHLTHGRGLLLNFIPVKLLYPWADRISSGSEEALYLPFLFNLFIHCKSKLSIVWERGSRREKLCSISSDKNYKWSFWKT